MTMAKIKEDNYLEEQKHSGKGTGTKSRQLFKDTLTRALMENDSKRLRALCEKMLGFAEHEAITVPDFLQIMKFLADRVDGRAAQSLEITDSSESLPSADIFKLAKILKSNE